MNINKNRQGLQLPVQVLLLAAHARVPINPAHNARGNATKSRHQPRLSLEYRPFEEKSLLARCDVGARAAAQPTRAILVNLGLLNVLSNFTQYIE